MNKMKVYEIRLSKLFQRYAQAWLEFLCRSFGISLSYFTWCLIYIVHLYYKFLYIVIEKGSNITALKCCKMHDVCSRAAGSPAAYSQVTICSISHWLVINAWVCFFFFGKVDNLLSSGTSVAHQSLCFLKKGQMENQVKVALLCAFRTSKGWLLVTKLCLQREPSVPCESTLILTAIWTHSVKG